MRPEVVAVFPFWSQSDAMNWDSNYAYLRRVLPLMSEMAPGWLWYVAWPEQGVGADKWHWADDGLFQNPRIVRFPWPYDTAMRTGVVSFHPDRFKAIETRLAPTIYWLHQVESGAFFKGGYEQGYAVSVRPAIVAQHHYIVHRSLPYPFDGLFPRLWAQMGGSIAADKVVFNSAYCLQMMQESFGEFLNFEQMERLNQKSEVLKFGLVEPALTTQPIREHPKPVVIYNHRFENYKRHQVTGQVLTDLRAEGMDFEVWVTQTRDQKVGDFPWDKVVGHADFETYIRNIAVPAVNTINSVHETFCISMLDSIALGQLPVAPNALTFPELVPEGYPFLFNSPTEQKDMLRRIFSTWPTEYNLWHQRLRDHAEATFGATRYAEAYLRLLADAGDIWLSAEAKPHIRAGMDAFFASLNPGRFAINEYASALRKRLKLAQQAYCNRRALREGAAYGLNFAYDRNRQETIVKWKVE